MKTYYFIKNNDGTTRFVWPVESKKPLFLKFCNSSSWKQIAFRLGVTTVYAFKLQRFFFNRTKTVFPELTSNDTRWALSLGTPGADGKNMLYTLSDSGKDGIFSKIIFQESDSKILATEIEQLDFLKNRKEKFSFQFPQVLGMEAENKIEINEIPFVRGSSKWTSRHSQAIIELSQINSSKESIENWSEWPVIDAKIKNLKKSPYSDKLSRNLSQKLSLLRKEISSEETYEFNMAHGDFTTSNTFITKGDKLGVIDWAMAMPSAPKGMDFFNFIVQKGILEEKLSVRYIIYEIFEIAQDENLFESEEEILKYLKLYLLFHITHYADKYANQQHWSKTMPQQIEAWEELLNEIITSWSKRKLFITDLIEFLSDKKYAALKLENSESTPITEFAEIDLLIKKSDLKAIKKWINNRSVVFRVQTRVKSCYTSLGLTFFDATELNLELICELKQKSTVFQDINRYIRSAQMNDDGVKQCTPRHTAQYIGLYCSLNHQAIPKKFEENAQHLLPLRSDLDELVFHFYKNEKKSRENLVKFVQKANENKGTSALTNKIMYFLDQSKDLFRQKELTAHYNGSDGSVSLNSTNKIW